HALLDRLGPQPQRARRLRQTARSLNSAAVRPGDDLEEVAARILEVHAAAAVVAVDLALPLLLRVGPVVETALLDAPEDLVELLLAHEEGVVLRFGLAVRVA